MTEPQTDRENAEVLQIKAQHQMARMEHEQAMALFDERSISRMPLALRLMFDDRLRERVQRAAEEMSKAVGFTPQHLLSKTEACLVVVTRAITWNLDPYSVAMSTYQTPGGKVGYEGALVRAILEASGELRGTIKHKYYGEWERLPRPSFKMVRGESGKMAAVPAWEYWSNIEVGLGVTISATLAETGEEMSLDFDLVDAHPRNATTWPTRPKLQLFNPAIRAFARQVRPSLLMGVNLRDDYSDAPEMRDVTPESVPDQQPKRSALSMVAAANSPPTPEPLEELRQRMERGFKRATQETEGEGGSGGSGPNKILVTAREPLTPQHLRDLEAAIRKAEPVDTSTSRDPIPQTAPGRPAHVTRSWADLQPQADQPTPSQDAPAPERVAEGHEPVASSGESQRRSRRTSEQVTQGMIDRVMAATTGEAIEDELKLSEYSRRSVSEKARIDAAAEWRSRELTQPQLRHELEAMIQERPPEPAGEARSQEPAATPAPGRAEEHDPETGEIKEPPHWVSEEAAPDHPGGGVYYLTDTRGDVLMKNLTASDFLAQLADCIDQAPSAGEKTTWKRRNQSALEMVIMREPKELSDQAVRLQP